MDSEEFQTLAFRTRYTAGISQRYHQICEWRWGFVDKSIRIAVGILSVVGFYLSLKGQSLIGCAECVGVLSMAIAVALNVIPTGEREKYHAEQFHRWSDLRKAAEVAMTKLTISAGTVSPALRERLSELVEAENALHGTEPAPWRSLLARCQEDENQSEWGDGWRTNEQIEAERQRKLNSVTS